MSSIVDIKHGNYLVGHLPINFPHAVIMVWCNLAPIKQHAGEDPLDVLTWPKNNMWN